MVGLKCYFLIKLTNIKIEFALGLGIFFHMFFFNFSVIYGGKIF